MFYHNGITHEIKEYDKETMGFELKGIIRAYDDAITTGFKTIKEAKKWDREWKYNEITESMDKLTQ